MNLRKIIRESINSVLLDSIISEEILHEASRATRNRYAGNRQANRYAGDRQQPQNLQQKRQQNVRQANQVAADKRQRANADRQERFNQWSNQHLPQGNPNAGQQGNYNVAPQDGYVYNNDETQQGGYGYTDSSFQNAGQGTSESPAQATSTQQPQQGQQQPQQATPQGQQQPAADFSQYADELRRLIGNSGFDATPVENNQAATQHIEKLNQFVFAVINAIDNGNINTANSAAAGGGGSSYSRWGRPYSKDGVDVAMDATNGIVGFTTDTAEKFLGQGSNNPFNGVFKAGGDAYKKTKGDIANYMNQKKYSASYNNPSQGANNEPNLTYLMQSIDEGCYPRLQSEYNQINQETNGIFGATPNVSNCHEVLRSLASAVTKYNTPQKQKQTTGNTVNNANNSSNRTTNDITKNNFEWFGEEIDKYGRGIESELYGANSEENSDIQLAMDRLNRLYKDCVSSIDTQTITMNNYVNGNNLPLTTLMGLSNEDYGYDNFMKIAGDFGSTIRQNSEKYPNTAKTFQLLANLHQKMAKENFKDTIHL